MKNIKNAQDKSAPYRTHSLARINAPVSPKGEPKAHKTQATKNGDLRLRRA
ncbi:MAG: hypothetical protein IKC32_04115 [Clostridia bacterium]|nr:hypothetical protein [Clostridia bacterium]